MPQKYAISLMMGNPSKTGEVKIYIRVFMNGKETRLPTSIKVNKKNFNGEKIVGTPLASKLNALLDKEFSEVKNKINEALFNDVPLSPELFKPENTVHRDFKSFVEKHIALNETRFSHRRIIDLKSTLKFIIERCPNLSFRNINTLFLQEFEKKISIETLKNGRQREKSTVLGIMTRFLSFIHAAEKQQLIEKKDYIYYKRPPDIRKLPVYLTENEIDAFYQFVKNLGNERKKNSGYYFLLSCYTGFRISDCKAFNYEERVKDNLITIRAKKNKEIVSIPVYSKLQNVLDYCRNHAFIETEQHARKSVKDICHDIGMKNYLEVKFHSGRHSFAMYCLSKGLTKDEVAELLGDTREVVEVYARIINPQLHKSVLEKLK